VIGIFWSSLCLTNNRSDSSLFFLNLAWYNFRCFYCMLKHVSLWHEIDVLSCRVFVNKMTLSITMLYVGSDMRIYCFRVCRWLVFDTIIEIHLYIRLCRQGSSLRFENIDCFLKWAVHVVSFFLIKLTITSRSGLSSTARGIIS